jgi:hypothetical protein
VSLEGVVEPVCDARGISCEDVILLRVSDVGYVTVAGMNVATREAESYLNISIRCRAETRRSNCLNLVGCPVRLISSPPPTPPNLAWDFVISHDQYS